MPKSPKAGEGTKFITWEKKPGKPSVLLDSRQTNHWTKKLPTKFVATQEICNHFAKAKYTSSVDVANAFFSIPLPPDKSSSRGSSGA